MTYLGFLFYHHVILTRVCRLLEALYVFDRKRQMRESTVPVSADKYDLKLLPRLFDGSIWFHQDPCQTTTRRALTKREKEGRRMWMRERTVHKHDGCWSSFHCFGYFQTLSLPNTSSLSNSFFQIQPGSLLNANHAVILHLECVCCSVCVWRAPTLSRQGEQWYGWH